MLTMPENELHQRVSAAACAHLKATEHNLRSGVSSHKVAHSLAFRNLSSFLDTIKKTDAVKAEQVFVGTVNGQLSVSVVFHYKKPPPPPVKKKRRKEEEEALDALNKKIDETLDRVRATAKTTNHQQVDEEVLSGAKQVLQSMLLQLKGSAGEEVVESWGLAAASPTGIHVGRPSLIFSMRMSGGVAVPVSVLRRALGASFADGMITSNNATKCPLPITEQGAITEREGQASMMLHASVAAL